MPSPAMAQPDSDAEKRPSAGKAPPPPQPAQEDSDTTALTTKKSGKRTLRFSEDVCGSASSDSPRKANTEEAVAEETNESEDEAEQSSSRNVPSVLYPLDDGLRGDSRPPSSSGVAWNISSGSSGHGLSPGGNGPPYSSNQPPRLHISGTNFSQPYAAYQPTGMDLYDSASLASPYSSMPMGRKYPQIPTSEYYTPGVATPSALHPPVRPDVNPSQALSHSPTHSDRPQSNTPPLSHHSMPYPQGRYSSNPPNEPPEKQSAQTRPQPPPFSESVIPLYTSAAPPKASIGSHSSVSPAPLPSDSLYSGEPYTQGNDSLPQGLYTGSQESSSQYTSNDNPLPPGYPSGPKAPKPKPKASKEQVMPSKAQVSAPQVSVGIPHPSAEIGTYQPYKEPEYIGYPLDSKIQQMSEPTKYMSPNMSMSKRPLAFVPQTSMSASKPLAYVRPSNSQPNDSMATPVQSSGQDARPSLPSYLPQQNYGYPLQHQNQNYHFEHNSSISQGLPAQKLTRVQGQVESRYYAAAPTPSSPAFLSEQYSAPSDYLGKSEPSGPPRLRPELQTSLPIPAGYVQALETPANGVHGSQSQGAKLHSHDFKTNDRPSQSFSAPVVQAPHVGLPINGDQTPIIPRPPSNPTYCPRPTSSFDAKISSSSSFASNSPASLQRPGSTAFHVPGISQHKTPEVPQIPPDVRLQHKQGYGQESVPYESQNSAFLSKQQGYLGPASIGQSGGEAFVPGYQTPKMRPPQQNQAPYDMNPLQSGASAYGQNQVSGQAVSLSQAPNAAATTYHNSEPTASVPYINSVPVPVGYGGSRPQQPNLYSGGSGPLLTSNQHGIPTSFDQLPGAVVSPHLGASNYGKAYNSNPSSAIGPGTPSFSQHALQSPYHIGNPNIPSQQGSSQYTPTNQYGITATPGISPGGQLSQPSPAGPQSNTVHHLAQYHSASQYPTGNQPQGGRFSHSASGFGSYASPANNALGVPGTVPQSGNMSQNGIAPTMQGISPLLPPFAGANGSIAPSSIPQSPAPPGTTVPPRPGLGWSGRPEGHGGAAQGKRFYEQYLQVLNGMGSMGIDNTGRM